MTEKLPETLSVSQFPHEGRALTLGNAVLASVKPISEFYFLIQGNAPNNLSDFSSLNLSSCKQIKAVCKREILYNDSRFIYLLHSSLYCLRGLEKKSKYIPQ